MSISNRMTKCQECDVWRMKIKAEKNELSNAIISGWLKCDENNPFLLPTTSFDRRFFFLSCSFSISYRRQCPITSTRFVVVIVDVHKTKQRRERARAKERKTNRQNGMNEKNPLLERCSHPMQTLTFAFWFCFFFHFSSSNREKKSEWANSFEQENIVKSRQKKNRIFVITRWFLPLIGVCGVDQSLWA